MDEFDLAETVGRLVTEHAGAAGAVVRADPAWVSVRPRGAPLADQGWKLHVSARIAQFPSVVERLVPVLLAERCVFKLARSSRALARLNDGVTTPSSVGKALTVYPDQNRVREIGLRLAAMLDGVEGPRVRSDRRISPTAPVYYRYGPFARPWTADGQGNLVSVLHGPGGEEFGGLATLRYRQPAWAVDPFTGERGSPPERRDRPADPGLIGDHYRVTAGVFRSGRGDVMRAVDQRDGFRVIVKQARALVDEDEGAVDARMRVRNERRVLTVLDGVPGVAPFVDHFRVGEDEYLVTRDVGELNLADDVTRNGRYLPAGTPGARPGRSLEQLGRRLSRILLDVHERGVLVRDLHPRNIVIDGDRASLIDFGLAGYEGLHLRGGTAGYSAPRQFSDAEPSPTDDFLALGATLVFAWSGLTPVVAALDADEPRRRSLQLLGARRSELPAAVRTLLADLMSMDDERSLAAAWRWALGDVSAPGSGPELILPPAPVPTPELVARIAESLRGDLIDQTRRVVTATGTHHTVYDACVFRGSAGLGLELLEHLDTPGVPDLLCDVAGFSMRAMNAVGLQPGLLTGQTGVDLFLVKVRALGLDTGVFAGAAVPGPDWKPEHGDLVSGASGVGLGHLELAGFENAGQHLDLARRCAEHILNSAAPDVHSYPNALPDEAAVEPSAGRAHGLAGTVDVLVAVGSRLGDEGVLAVAAERAEDLAVRARRLAMASRGMRSAPLSVSWCQGLSGMAQSLIGAGTVLGDPALIGAARVAADACLALVPRMDSPIQCCGLAGVGNMLIDLAAHDERYWDGAYEVVGQMLLRSSGPAAHPVFIKDDPGDYSASWAYGIAGILGFYRRLAERGRMAVPLG